MPMDHAMTEASPLHTPGEISLLSILSLLVRGWRGLFRMPLEFERLLEAAVCIFTKSLHKCDKTPTSSIFSLSGRSCSRRERFAAWSFAAS